jgi:apolipoprotein N-acyltransferase
VPLVKPGGQAICSNQNPWNSVAYTQYGNLPLVQLASVTGIWGITFVVAVEEHSFARRGSNHHAPAQVTAPQGIKPLIAKWSQTPATQPRRHKC